MENIQEQLAYLQETKTQIKQAIVNKGQNVQDSDTFRSYATKISNISTLNAQAKTVSPTTNQQLIEPDQNFNALSSVTINAVTSNIDQNIMANNIKNGINILGVVGNVTELNGTTLNVTPTTNQQTITPTSPFNGFTSINIEAVTSNIDANITANNIKNGVTILGVTGTYTEQMKEYASETAMNNDIANIQEGEVVKVVDNGISITVPEFKNLLTNEYPDCVIIDYIYNTDEINLILFNKDLQVPYVDNGHANIYFYKGIRYKLVNNNWEYISSHTSSFSYGYQHLYYTDVDIYNISYSEVVYPAIIEEISFYLKETTMKKLVKEEETISPQEYEENVEITEDILGENN